MLTVQAELPAPSTVRADLSEAFGRSAFLTRWVSRALCRRMTRSFAGLNRSGEVPEPLPGQGILFYTNHPSWWDPAMFAVLQQRFFPERVAFGPIDALTLQRYPFLGRAGFLPVDPKSSASLRSLLVSASHILSSGGVFWITAQGEFTDAQTRPVRLRPGLAHIVARSPGCMIVPVALDYRFTSESRPEAFIRFGRSISPVALPQGRVATQEALERALEETMDTLSQDILLRRPVFSPLTSGRSGMGGLYASLQRASAIVFRKRYDPRHARR